jgi:hypothetical protein
VNAVGWEASVGDTKLSEVTVVDERAFRYLYCKGIPVVQGKVVGV